MTSSDAAFPHNARVVLQGLVKSPQLNGKQGIVKSDLVNDRQHVYIEELSKSVALKISNLKYEVRTIDSLSIKELKTLLLKKNVPENEIKGSDKNELQRKASALSYESDEEIAKIIATANAQSKSSSPSSAQAAMPSASQAANAMSNLNPEQLRQQARMMRGMTPDQIRRMNPQLANMTDSQIQMSINQMEMMANNPEMMKMATEQMKNMSPDEIERVQRQMAGGTSTSNGSIPPAASTTPSASQASNVMANMSPEQLKQQAQMMKSMDPNTVRSMNPQLAHMTDAQIQMAAQQMEMMANNPEMMKMATEQMKNMNPEDIQKMQQMGGAVPSPTAGGMDPSKLMANMDSKQVKQMVSMMKDNPEMLKQYAQASGMSEDQMSKGLEMFSNLDEKQLNTALKYMAKAEKARGAVRNVWDKVNNATGGHLFKIIVVFVIAVVSLIIQRIWFVKNDVIVATSAEDLANTIPQMEQDAAAGGYDSREEEFSEF